MYDIKLLEEEWKKYQKKKRKPFMLMGISILFVLAVIAVLYYSKSIETIWNKKKISIPVAPVEKQVLSFIENKPLKRLEIKETEKIQILENTENSDEIVEDLPIPDDQPVRKKPRVKMNIVTTEMPMVKKKVLKEEKAHKRKYLLIKESSSVKAYKDVAKRFRETKDIDDSLFLARTYYRMGKYKKAEYWALQTNNVNSNIEESILIFAKAKVKLGHKNEAIRILSKYIKGSDSSEARELLKKIKKGKL